jgi:hypothetical protein
MRGRSVEERAICFPGAGGDHRPVTSDCNDIMPGITGYKLPDQNVLGKATARQ